MTVRAKYLFALTLLLLLPVVAIEAEGAVRMVGIPFEPTGNTSVQAYIQALYRLAIGVAALLAVVKLILAGAKYILSDVITQKEDAKQDIRSAIIGLLIVLSAALILSTINPNLLNLRALDSLDGVSAVLYQDPPRTPSFTNESVIINVSNTVGDAELERRELDCIDKSGQWRELNNSYQCIYPEGAESAIIDEIQAERTLEMEIQEAFTNQEELRDQSDRPLVCARRTDTYRACVDDCIANSGFRNDTPGRGTLCTYAD